MARKRSAAVAPRPTIQSVEAELKKFEFTKALELFGLLVDAEPTLEHLGGYARTLARCIDGYLAQNKVKAATETIRLAEAFAQKHESQRPAIAATLARCGEFAKALALADSATTRMHIADLCVRRNRADGAPPEIKAEFAIVQAAFRDYEAGRDDAARDALGKLGLTSSYLSWKLLLRGLLAFAANDPARALENWQRLPADGLAAQLAAPLRGRIDPDFRKALPADRAAAFDRATENLLSGGLVGDLREIQKHTGRDRDLAPIWKHVAILLPKLRAAQPAMMPRLAAALYHVIIRQGRPEDLDAYRRQFPPPADDPKFDRMRARGCERTGEDDYAIEYWIAYEKWLATAPAGWPPDLLARARAIVLHRVGSLIEDMNIEDEAPADLRRAMSKMFGEPLEPSNFGNPDDYYRKSLELAPEWPMVANDLFDRYVELDRLPAAERVAVDYLARRPDDLEMLKRLTQVLRMQGRCEERLVAARRAAAVNPLDKGLDGELTQSYVTVARMHLIQSDLEACERILADAGTDREAAFPAAFGSLRAILAHCRKRTAEAEEIEARLFALPGRGPVATLYLSVFGSLAGLKPAQRKPADQRLKALLTQTHLPADETLYLLSPLTEFAREGVDYRGRASIEKKILALAERSTASEGDEATFEMILRMLMHGAHFKPVIAMAPRLAARFPKSPIFPLFELQAIVMKSPGKRPTNAVMGKLNLARRLADACDRPDRADLLDAIKKIQSVLDPFGGRFLFGGSFPFDDFDGDDH